jgi:two-component system sensor histidine kinase/response regulator
MTANAMPQDRERCLAAGMNDHVAKPIEPALLWQTLLRWDQARGAGDRSARSRAAPRACRAASPAWTWPKP